MRLGSVGETGCSVGGFGVVIGWGAFLLSCMGFFWLIICRRISRKGRFPTSSASSVSLKVSSHSLSFHPSTAVVEKLELILHYRDADLTSYAHIVTSLISPSLFCLLRRLSMVFPPYFPLRSYH